MSKPKRPNIILMKIKLGIAADTVSAIEILAI